MLTRLLFALRHLTLKPVALSGEQVLACHKGGVTAVKRRCPHQGAPLEEGWIEGDDLICPWHGCRFPLAGSGPGKPFAPR